MEQSVLLRAGRFSVASVSTEYPTEETRDTLRDLAAVGGLEQWLTPLARATEEDLGAVQSKYSSLFELPKERVPLNETEHGRMRGMAKGNDLADIGGFYLAFGLEPDGAREMLDHLAVELEFYSHLLLREGHLLEAEVPVGAETVRDARRKFLEGHLGRFVKAIATAPRVSEDEVYGPVLAWCATLVQDECDALQVTPPPLDFFADTGERDDTSCGGVHLPVIGSQQQG